MVVYDEEHNRILAPAGNFITNDGKEFVIVHYLSNSDRIDDWWDIPKEEAERILVERSEADESLSADS